MLYIKPARPNLYSGGALDRAGHLREDPDWQAAARANPQSRTVFMWHGQPLLSGTQAPRAVLLPVPEGDVPSLFLGLLAGVPLFAVDVSAETEVPNLGEGVFSEMRGTAGLLPPDDAALLATARGMFHWRNTHKFCPACGGATAPERAGWVLRCSACAREHFPRTDAAVIMLVTRGETLLLGQSLRFPPERNYYSTLAGFVEPGEALEDAVRREVFEETGVRVGEVMYHSSQPWPFPASLMLGYYAEGLTAEINIDPGEMRDAKWFSRADIENRAALGFNLPPSDSIARRLIEDWLNAPG